MLDLTETCNLRCKMCHYWGEDGVFTKQRPGLLRHKPATLDIEVALRLVEELAPGGTSFSLFGGEPLLYPHLETLIAAIKKAGLEVSMVTNGVSLEEHAAMLVALGVDAIRVSIDGPEAINDAQRGAGSFQKAMNGLKALSREAQKQGRKKPSLGVPYAVTPENHLHIEQFFLHELDPAEIDFYGINMYIYFSAERGEAYQRMLEEEFKTKGQGQWRAQLRDPAMFDDLDYQELSRQILAVKKQYRERGGRGNVETAPRVVSAANLRAYLHGENAGEQYAFCYAPFNTCQIAANGDLLPCMGYTDLRFENIGDKPFLDIWHGERFNSLRQRLVDKGLMPQCQSCCMLYRMGHWKNPLSGRL